MSFDNNNKAILLTTLNKQNSKLYLKIFEEEFSLIQFSLVEIKSNDMINYLNKKIIVKARDVRKKYVIIIGSDDIKNSFIRPIRKAIGYKNILVLSYDLAVTPKFFPLVKFFINNTKARKSFYLKEPSLFFVDCFNYIKKYLKRI